MPGCPDARIPLSRGYAWDARVLGYLRACDRVIHQVFLSEHKNHNASLMIGHGDAAGLADAWEYTVTRTG